MKERAIPFLPAFVGFCVVTLSFSGIAMGTALHARSPVHYLAHLFAFGLLAFLAARVSSVPRTKVLLLVLTLLLGIAIEVSEHVIYQCEALEFGDILADSFGALLGFGAALSKDRRRQ